MTIYEHEFEWKGKKYVLGRNTKAYYKCKISDCVEMYAIGQYDYLQKFRVDRNNIPICPLHKIKMKFVGYPLWIKKIETIIDSIMRFRLIEKVWEKYYNKKSKQIDDFYNIIQDIKSGKSINYIVRKYRLKERQ